MRGHGPGRAVSTALVMITLVGIVVLAAATPALAGENVFVEVRPSTIQAGSRVDIRAGCDRNNDRQAEVTSDAFGRVVLRPHDDRSGGDERSGTGPDHNGNRADSGFLTGAVTVPASTAPGDYPVELRCPNGNRASTVLTVLNMTQPSKGPATGGGGTAGGRGAGSLLLVGGLVTAAVVAGLGLFGSRRRPGSP
ncbi:hypothetical protein [Micromonospora sagamiensis]|uniref:Uncharacterized protein n=2 Tax=Micromonospora sagamiensis TaxID=47875 RepID=A0A562WBH1_9ACTN|nr:hypothetical protein JD81_01114 [Micromonospora sagamiensis]BCL13493.1 hypothetical protein GCM10017556_12320 [Micromonospora sagamiensis]